MHLQWTEVEEQRRGAGGCVVVEDCYVKRLEWEGTCLRKYSWQAAEPALGPVSLLEESSH